MGIGWEMEWKMNGNEMGNEWETKYVTNRINLRESSWDKLSETLQFLLEGSKFIH